MTISQRLKDIFGRRRFAVRPGTERINGLLARLDHPERAFSAIHIVGTNGKGSTASFLSSILTAAGCRTGLFTSPHLINYNERFQIDGQAVTDEELSNLLDKVLAVASEEDTFFELTTALACLWFAEQKVQVAVMEAGMGGRSDATAAIPAIFTVITPISLDHCRWLGHTLPEIATEKAAIAEAGTTVLSAKQQPQLLELLEQQARDRQQKLLVMGKQFDLHQESDGTLIYADSKLKVSGLVPALAGSYQHENAGLAVAAAHTAAEILKLPVDGQHIRQGLANASWPGRMELIRLPDGKTVLLDGAHNPAGAKALQKALQDFTTKRIFLLLGMMADKAAVEVVSILGSAARLIVTVKPDQERAITADRLAELCRLQGFPVLAGGLVAEGLSLALAQTCADDLVVVAGSLFLVGEVKALLSGQDCCAVRG